MNHKEVIHIRRSAAEYTTEVSELCAESIPLDGFEFDILNGGVMSACIRAKTKDTPVILKFRTQANPSEGEILSVWNANGLRTPEVYAFGTVPSTKDTDIPVGYTIMKAIIDLDCGDEDLAPTADAVVGTKPWLARSLGGLVGEELGRMHACPVSHSSVGSIDVIDEFNNNAATWSGYIGKELERLGPLLNIFGFSDEQIAVIISNAMQVSQSDVLAYVHNDISARNVLVRSSESLDFTVVDPNPIIGDKHWDLAFIRNKAISTSQKATSVNSAMQAQHEFYASIIEIYEEQTGPLNKESLLVCQLIRSLKKLNWMYFTNVEGEDFINAYNTPLLQANLVLNLK